MTIWVSRTLSSLLLLVGPATLRGQVVAKLGFAAPPISLTELLQAPAGSVGTWNSLRGKAVVLEFWATWCAGCVDHIAKLNTLAAEFKDRPVQFISVTEEEESIVSHFLQRYPINGWIALEAQENMMKSFGIQGIPRTVLVDANGILRAITNPDSLNSAVLNDLLEGRELDISEPTLPVSTTIGTERNAPLPLVSIIIRPAAPVQVSHYSPGSEEVKPGHYQAWGLTLHEIVAEAYGYPPQRVQTPPWCDEVSYDLSVLDPAGTDSDRLALLKSAILNLFHIRAHSVWREITVYELRKVPGHATRLLPSTTSEVNSRPWGRKGELDAIGVRLPILAGVAKAVLNSEVFDETGMRGAYDFDLKWDHDRPESIIFAIRDQLGLQLVHAHRKVAFLILDNVQEPKKLN